MTRGAEATRQARFHFDIAALQLKDFAAGVAMEMVMVFLASHFVTCGIAGYFYRQQPVLFHQRTDVPVHSRETNAINILLRVGERFFW